MRRYIYVLCLLLLLSVLVGCTATATPVSTPEVKHYITFKEAYVKAQVAVIEWDKEGVLISAHAYPEPDQNGMATSWSFWMSAPTQGNDLVIGANGKGGIGIAEKGGLVCVDGEAQWLWNVAHKLDCEFDDEVGLTRRVAKATRCLQEAADNGEIAIAPCIDSQGLTTGFIPIRIEEIEVDSTEAVSLARQNGWADVELVDMYLREGMWTLTFSVTENNERTYQYVKVDAQTGEVKPLGSINQLGLTALVIPSADNVTLHIYDESGRHLGPGDDGTLETEIRNASYLSPQLAGGSIPGARRATIPGADLADGYMLELHGTSAGSFNLFLEVPDCQESVLQHTTFISVPVTADAVFYLSLQDADYYLTTGDNETKIAPTAQWTSPLKVPSCGQ